MKEIRCDQDLRLADCDLVVRGEVPGEIVSEVVQHLRENHDLDLPEADAIVKGKVDESDVDEKTWKIVQRLRDALEISDVGVRDEESAAEERPGLAVKT